MPPVDREWLRCFTPPPLRLAMYAASLKSPFRMAAVGTHDLSVPVSRSCL